MIFITGDTHIPIDISKLSSKNFHKSHELTKDDIVIICGDFGGIWDKSAEELYWLNWLNNKNFTTYFIDGNHENHIMLNEFEQVEINGGKARKIRDSIYHLMRGQVFEICNKKFFTMGGATSHDKELRQEGVSWWKEELPSKEEYKEANLNLEKHNWTVDYIITHCASNRIQKNINPTYDVDELTNYLDKLEDKLKFQKWYFGHYHIDEKIDSKHIVLYNDIIEI